MSTYVPAAVRRYWTRVAALGCVLCGGPAEIAHCHGGSVRDRLQEPKAKGKKLGRLNWLVLPLCPQHGREPYPTGLDTNVAAWEDTNGPQTDFLDKIANELGVDVWALATEGRR